MQNESESARLRRKWRSILPRINRMIDGQKSSQLKILIRKGVIKNMYSIPCRMLWKLQLFFIFPCIDS